MSTPPTHENWTIRPYQPGDERDLVHLFHRAFGHAITEEYWRWKLKQLPSPVENVWLAIHGDQPIFQYGGIPCRFHLPTGEQTAMISVYVMTAPEFRRRGLLTNVGRFVYDTWREAGIPFTFGPLNQQWGTRAEALGWEALFSLSWLIRPLRPATTLAQRFGAPALSPLPLLNGLWNGFWNRSLKPDTTVEIEPVSQAGPAFDRLWAACAPDIKVSVVRDRQWIQWRYLSTPSQHYQVLLARRAQQPIGYLVYQIKDTPQRKLGFIVELLTPSYEVEGSATLTGHVLDLMLAEEVDAVFTLAIPKTPLYRTFRRAGFFFTQAPFTVHIAPLTSDLPMETLRNLQNWYLVGGEIIGL